MKLFAFDLDKTTLNSKGKLSTSNAKVLNDMISKNIILIPTTGRNIQGIPNEILRKEIRYAIVSNGAVVLDLLEEKEIWQSRLSKKELEKLICRLKKKRFLFTIHANGKCFDSNIIQVVIRKLVFRNSSKLFPKFSNITEFENIDKIQLTFFSKKQLSVIYSLISDISSVHVVKSSKHSIEITNKEATKGNALRFISEYLKIDRDEIASIGDNDNDIEMLLFSGTSYAVCNSSISVKKIADYIISSNDDNPLEDILLD